MSKGRIFLSLFAIVLPVLGFSQSTLNFPKSFSQPELSNTGFAVVNPNTSAATVTFTLYRADGSVVASRTYTGTEVPGGGQLAKLGSEIFPSASSGGWVQATSTTLGLQALWMNYNGSLTAFDGAESATPAVEQVIPLAAGQTEVNIANPNTALVSVTVRYINEAGQEITPSTPMTIPPKGVVQLQAPQSSALRHVRVSSSQGVAATALIRGYLVPQTSVETTVVNGINVADAGTEAVFPHLVSGSLTGANYATDVGISNLSAQSQTVTLTFTPDNGPAINRTRLIAANGALRERAADLFGLPSTYVGGWLRVTGTAALTGYVAYADTVQGALVAVASSTPKNNLLFAHIANGPAGASPWETGLALLNTGSTDATVEFYAMTPTGAALGNSVRIAPGNGRLVNQLHSWIPQTANVNGGFVFVRSSAPLYGIELFYTRDVKILSNVPAGGLVGVTYTPPGGPTLISIAPGQTARGSVVNLSGTGFSTTPASNLVRFTTVNGTEDVAATTATANTLSVTVPATAISGPVLVRVGNQSSNSAIIIVSQTSTEPLSTTTNVTAGQTTSNINIYVPTATAPANATMIGLADPGAPGFTFGYDSLEIAAGATKDLLVVLTAPLTQSNGTALRISGNGVSVSNPRFSTSGDGSPILIVQVQVTGAAATGPRNIIVTNNNLDVAVFTGGLYIK